MKYYVEFWNDSGLLQREGVEELEPREEGAEELTIMALDIEDRASLVWDPTARAFVSTVPAAPEKRTAYPRKEFLRDIIGPEAMAQALELQKTDTFVEAFRMLLFEEDIIHTDDPLTIKGVGYLKSKGVNIANPGAF